MISLSHVDGLYWVAVLEQIESIGRPLGTVSLSAILDLPDIHRLHMYFQGKLPATDSMGAPLSLQVMWDWNEILR